MAVDKVMDKRYGRWSRTSCCSHCRCITFDSWRRRSSR